jgi:hypothetical protein
VLFFGCPGLCISTIATTMIVCVINFIYMFNCFIPECWMWSIFFLKIIGFLKLILIWLNKFVSTLKYIVCISSYFAFSLEGFKKNLQKSLCFKSLIPSCWNNCVLKFLLLPINSWCILLLSDRKVTFITVHDVAWF